METVISEPVEWKTVQSSGCRLKSSFGAQIAYFDTGIRVETLGPWKFLLTGHTTRNFSWAIYWDHPLLLQLNNLTSIFQNLQELDASNQFPFPSQHLVFGILQLEYPRQKSEKW